MSTKLVLLVFLFRFIIPRASTAQTRQEFTHLQMGTQFRVVFYEADYTKAQQVANSCWKRLDELNLVMSDYRSDSEIMQLCVNAKVGEWQRVSEDLYNVIAESQRAAKLTNGLFDVTISPLTKLWRRARRQHKLPDDLQVQKAMQIVGYQFVEMNQMPQSIRFLKPNMRLDFGGIGKGLALDELMKILKNEGVNSFLLEAGGSLLLGSPPPNEDSWKITIVEKEYNLVNCGISTSGDKYQFVEVNGKRYAHILDPRTGFGFHEPHTVTVIANDATTADWASTAAYLMSDMEQKLLAATVGVKIIR